MKIPDYTYLLSEILLAIGGDGGDYRKPEIMYKSKEGMNILLIKENKTADRQQIRSVCLRWFLVFDFNCNCNENCLKRLKVPHMTEAGIQE